jgi:Tol biopolymer transport system component/DNA-binding winged helix-turn-helix (wHTH) protein
MIGPTSNPATNARLSFGLYEVDLQTGEIWKAGFRIKLQTQPFKVLATLLERPGQVVSREELQERLWGKDTIVDFDHSLGTAINKIREALGDSADNPRFIETLARRGYRFIAPVGHIPATPPAEPIPIASEATLLPPATATFQTTLTPPATSGDPVHPALLDATPAMTVTSSPAVGLPLPLALPTARPRPYHLWAIAAIAIGTACVASFVLGSSRSAVTPPHITQITHNGHLAPSIENMENLAAVTTDGVHLFAATIDNGHSILSAISLAGGSVTPLNLPAEVASPALGDISPDGSRLLLRDHLSPESEQPLWVVPTIGGSALRVGDVLAHDATWMPTDASNTPDDNAILFANGNQLFLTHLNGNDPKPYATLPGRAFWLRWSPNGHLLRFTILDPIAHTLSLWQLTPSNRSPQRILAGFSTPSSECCGVWTPDGKSYVFQSTHNGNSDLWRLSGQSTSAPTRLTDGPLQFQSPVAARPNSQHANRIFFLGADARSELETLSPTGDLVPERGFLAAAVRVDYSRDGNWVAWTDSSGQLWRARSDGSERLQLTPDNLDVFLARWSPDAQHLAIMAREPGKAWQIYLISGNGGDPEPLLIESRNAADPSFSPDGQSIVFGRVNDAMGKENASRTLQILHLQPNGHPRSDPGAIEVIPGSENLFSPRWSPDGRYIAALTLDQRQVRLYSVATRTWSRLPVPSGADPVWSSDSRYLFLHASLDPAQPIDRVSIPDGHVEELVRLADSRQNDAVDFVFGGLTRDNRPLIRARLFTGNLYSLDLK